MALTLQEVGNGPPVIFLHGWTMAGDVFADQMVRLSDRYHCIAPDLPGHGHSGGEPSVRAAADALADMLGSRDLRGVTLVGWSLGAAVMWNLLDRHGADRIARMVSVDMSPRIANGADWSLGMYRSGPDTATTMAHHIARDWPGAARAIARGMFAAGGGDTRHLEKAALRRILSNDPARMTQFWASLVAADAREVITHLPLPLLVIHGAQSRVYPPETANWLTETAPDARRVRIEDAGHAPHLEQPAAFAAALRAFIA